MDPQTLTDLVDSITAGQITTVEEFSKALSDLKPETGLDYLFVGKALEQSAVELRRELKTKKFPQDYLAARAKSELVIQLFYTCAARMYKEAAVIIQQFSDHCARKAFGADEETRKYERE